MLTSVSLYNFKCLRKVKNVRLSKINILTGVNGEGKSSFVQALLVLSQTWKKNIYDLLDSNSGELVSLGGFMQVLSYDANPKEMTIGLSFDGKDEEHFELRYDTSEQKGEYGELSGLKFNDEEMLDNASVIGTADDEGPLTSTPVMGTLDSYPALMSLKRIYYVAANRCAACGVFNKNNFKNEDKFDPNGSNVLKMIACLNPKDNSLLKEYMNRIFEGATINVYEDDENYRLQMDSNAESGHLFNPVNVGYGYSYVLTMVTSLVLAKNGDIIIIENPEAHLHPSAQAAVMKIFAEVTNEKDVQFIIETHSDHIVNGALVAVNQKSLSSHDLEVMFFNKGQVQNLEVTENGRIMNPPQKFCDQYSKDLDILFGDIASIFE